MHEIFTACAAAVLTQAITEVGSCDGSYPYYNEHVHLGFRLHQIG